MAVETNKVPVTIKIERKMARTEACCGLPLAETMSPARFL